MILQTSHTDACPNDEHLTAADEWRENIIITRAVLGCSGWYGMAVCVWWLVFYAVERGV